MGCIISGLRSGEEVTKDRLSQNDLESSPVEGDRPVDEKSGLLLYVFPSSASLVKPGVNLGGPPPEAKYFLATGSE